MKQLKIILPITIAIFSMFFGAGNTIYPIVLAIHAKSKFSWAFLGLILTAIIGPLLGLIGGSLFKGRSLDFFSKAGKYPGFALLGASLALLGPFAVLPRCVSVSFSAIQTIIPICPLFLFAFVFCALAVLCCFKKKYLLPILGYALSPTLILCLLLIIFKGFSSPEQVLTSAWSTPHALSFGLLTGYETMDLVASIIFSAGIWNMVSQAVSERSTSVLKTILITGSLACALLAFIYFGIGYAAALHGPALAGLPKQELMPKLALLVLGPHLGVVANITVALACFTTVIGLTMTIANIVSKEIFSGKISYLSLVIGILLTTTFMTNIGFETISHLILFVMKIFYPVIIVLTGYNIFYKLVLVKKRKSLV